VRGHRGGHEEHSIQTKGLTELVGEEEVAKVDRVERPAEDADRGHRVGYSRT